MTGLGCYLCGDMTHWRELCPWNAVAATFEEHQHRIQVFIDRMVANHISVAMKREFVENEHRLWNSRKKKAA